MRREYTPQQWTVSFAKMTSQQRLEAQDVNINTKIIKKKKDVIYLSVFVRFRRSASVEHVEYYVNLSEQQQLWESHHEPPTVLGQVFNSNFLFSEAKRQLNKINSKGINIITGTDSHKDKPTWLLPRGWEGKHTQINSTINF